MTTVLRGSDNFDTEDVLVGVAKAWVNFNGTGSVAIRSSFNVSSITDNGTGNYTASVVNLLASTYPVAGNYNQYETAAGSGNDGQASIYQTISTSFSVIVTNGNATVQDSQSVLLIAYST